MREIAFLQNIIEEMRCSVHARLWDYNQIEVFSACSTVGLLPD